MATFLKDDQNVLVRDQNRFRKIYRYIRKKPRPLSCEGSDISNFVWGGYFVEFKHQAEVEHHFPCCYEKIPAVIATTVSKEIQGTDETVSTTPAKVSFMTFGEEVNNETDSSDTVVGSINAQRRGYIEREWIDLKNVDGTIYRIKFAADPTNTPTGYSPDYQKTISLSNVSHYGLGTTYSGDPPATPAIVTFDLKHQVSSTNFISTDLITSSVGTGNPAPLLSSFLENLWFDFSNTDGTVWRIKVADSGDLGSGQNYPDLHTDPITNSRTIAKEFNITVSGVSTLGQWLTEFINQLDTVTVSGSKFSDKWETSFTNGGASAPARLKFTSKTGNKGTRNQLAETGNSSYGWHDTYSRRRQAGEPDSIAIQSGGVVDGTNSETETTGLLTQIINEINTDSTFSQKWTASASPNSIERIFNNGAAHYETFVLTFTATSSNEGVISNIEDSGGVNPGTFYYHIGQYISINNVALNPGVDFFVLTGESLYRNERYPDLDTSPDPAPILTAVGTRTSTPGGGNTVTNPNFNVFITDISKDKCIFRTSGYFTGYVHYQAIEDGVYEMPNIGRELEVKTLQFDGTNDFVTYQFQATFKCDPIVTVSADEDVNAFVTSLSKTSVTVEVSKTGYKGKVYLQAIEKGC